MKNAFGEEIRSQPVLTKKTPWPIKLVMKLGARNEAQANIIVIVISVILLIITVIIYKNIFFDSPSPQLELTPEQIELINSL